MNSILKLLFALWIFPAFGKFATSVSITKVISDGQNCTVFFNLPLTGNYVAGGDTVNFETAVQDPAFQGNAVQIPASQAPVSLDIWDAGGNLLNQVNPILGTTQANCKVKFGAASTFGTEFAAGAYSAALLAAKLEGQAVFHKNI
jgi:hypothetical protein